MFFIYFLYALALGVFLYLIFKSQILVLLFYICVAELIIYILYFKYSLEYNPFTRLLYNICVLLGYFSGLILYGGIDRHDPNIPFYL